MGKIEIAIIIALNVSAIIFMFSYLYTMIIDMNKRQKLLSEKLIEIAEIVMRGKTNDLKESLERIDNLINDETEL